MSRLLAIILAAFFAVAQADVYLHSPRGQNDRCDEKSNNRNNEERCYNSQNNAAGGYSYCDKQMIFYTNTEVAIQWYSQHNCGNGAQVKTDPNNPEYLHCNHVFQIGCQQTFLTQATTDAATYSLVDGKSLGRPGADQWNTVDPNVGAPDDYYNTFGDTCTETKPTSAECSTNPSQNDPSSCYTNLAQGTGTFNSATCQCSARKNQTYCYHEPEAFWLKCSYRERNQGLFTADQNPGTPATDTRQQPNSARYGFECPEEKDYWPYWHPTPWVDLVVFVSDMSMCSYYAANSQNKIAKNECVPNDNSPPPVIAPSSTTLNCYSYNQQIPCTSAGCTWNTTQPWSAYGWSSVFPCLLAPSQPDNSLARVDAAGDNSQHVDGSSLASYTWTVPDYIVPQGQDNTTCIIRLRYNISSYEISFNQDKTSNGMIYENPVYVTDATLATWNNSALSVPLRLAINTAQYGRTFEDRTYSFIVQRTRPAGVSSTATIWNVNVRGKRGNIAQVRNCFEYDFVPHVLQASVGDYVFFQWCLSDYNDNGNAGEGRDGTDRVNVVPVAGNNFGKNIQANLTGAANSYVFNLDDVKALAWIGQLAENCYSVEQMLTTAADSDQDPQSCHYLNGVRDNSTSLPTSYFGILVQVQAMGTFNYISSRNNNFSNRSQKAAIIVNTFAGGLSAGGIAGIVVGVVVGVAVVAGVAFLVVKKGGISFASRV